MPAEYNEQRYDAARLANIRRNRRVTGRRKLEAAIAQDSAEFKFWLLGTVELAGDGDDTPAFSTREQQDAFRRQYKYPPEFILNSIQDWGGLTEKQLDCARRIWNEKRGQMTERAAADAARREAAPAWREGRQQVQGVVRSVKVQTFNVGYGRATTQYKALLALADGRLLWTSVPSVLIDFNEPASLRGKTIQMTVAIKPKDDDKSFAFGSRPTSPSIVENN